jgi:hypothetical protein
MLTTVLNSVHFVKSSGLPSNVSNDRVGTPARQVRTQLACRGWRLRSIALLAASSFDFHHPDRTKKDGH